MAATCQYSAASPGLSASSAAAMPMSARATQSAGAVRHSASAATASVSAAGWSPRSWFTSARPSRAVPRSGGAGPAPTHRASRPAAPRPRIDAGGNASRDRRAGVERAIELSRWIVLIFAAVSNNFPGLNTGRSTGEVNLLLGVWALFNLTATVMLVANRLPGRRTQIAMIVLDTTVASGLVYLTGGYASDLAVAFYLVVMPSGLRIR